MTIDELEKALEKNLDDFKSQIHFDLETFEQHRASPYLVKDDMEEIYRQTFYALNDMKNIIVKYLREKGSA